MNSLPEEVYLWKGNPATPVKLVILFLTTFTETTDAKRFVLVSQYMAYTDNNWLYILQQLTLLRRIPETLLYKRSFI